MSDTTSKLIHLAIAATIATALQPGCPLLAQAYNGSNTQLANTQLTNAQPANAQPANTQLAMATPGCDPANLRVMAQKNYQCSQFRIAQQMYKQVCQMPGVTGDDYYWLGESYMHASMFTEASIAFQQGVKLSPASDALNLGLVQSLLAARQMTQAHDACLKAASSVTAPQTRKQLEVLLKVASMPLPPAMRADARAQNHVER
jgi:cytochrome c-type biogenesis protein CcmH/NrfG